MGRRRNSGCRNLLAALLRLGLDLSHTCGRTQIRPLGVEMVLLSRCDCPHPTVPCVVKCCHCLTLSFYTHTHRNTRYLCSCCVVACSMVPPHKETTN